jgi:hypothetical protein
MGGGTEYKKKKVFCQSEGKEDKRNKKNEQFKNNTQKRSVTVLMIFGELE